MKFENKLVTDKSQVKEGEIAYDIAAGVDAIKEYIKKTISHRKAFRKIAKKMDGANPNQQMKLNYKFSKENLMRIFKLELEKEFFKRDELSFIPEEKLHAYILGSFIAAGSQDKGLKNNLEKIYVRILVEITQASQSNRMIATGA